MQVVSDAEMSCLALANEMKKQNHDVLVAIDERTARMLSEKPENLEQTMSAHLHKRVRFEGNLNIIKDIKIVRSSELVYVAYKKGLIDLKDPESLEALIYATKYKGAAISWDEINQLKKL
jgi:UDP:flavonoid glycosyltransferase YjiC (YdhE family)